MNKKLLYSLIASLSMISAGAHANTEQDASDSALTTKGYVNAGLEYVYKIAEGNETGTVKTLKDTVGNTAMGTNAGTVTGAIAELNTTINGDGDTSDGLVGDINDIKGALYDNNGNPINVKTLKGTVDNLVENSAIEGAENGVKIINKKVQLDVDTVANTTYVYKTNAQGIASWQALEVEDSWDDGFLH
jgi:hypothetical protein